MTFLLCGQTDAGKSTIAGHLLYRNGFFKGAEGQHLHQHLEGIATSTSKSKFSVLMDLLDGEILLNKTKTVDFHVCLFESVERKQTYTLIDTPGHQLYIRAMIAGLYHQPVHLICLVMSSLPDEFRVSWERGTVKEDLLLSRSTGCKELLILWNKCDLGEPTVDMKDEVETYASRRLRFSHVHHLSVSGYQGINLDSILEYVPAPMPLEPSESVALPNQLRLWGHLSFHPRPGEVISAGYQCVMHHSSGEYECEIHSFRDKVRFVKVNDFQPLHVTLDIDRPVKGWVGDKVILRKDQSTVGFGVLLKNRK